ncbi:DEHA2B01386p [Debaryomyces hansenii CBS767]|uniref:DEHA2B01386p n=1 Tax=Debaryomyces hansenii (strain ATCC 36239 / CBS 767 / BCRC 21394 / JCM 1990 / NBRC 0083 / IGC 2968) TaxID=284592 RepID=Q6BXP2_DEBHA|nr:DEHA2B01386p [Debaryomyces hansenii CBS767]CAG85012.2 DEHA2B01386p [Debaryomyces hansenii CBS767]|eukprot:XP_457027.2 DEHA2B01386p [Debaryomyces hansenii CBS767]
MSNNNNKEEEQLLQDASTLLMFANVAAKQQQEQLGNKASPTPPPSQMPVPTFQSNPQSQHSSISPPSSFQPLRTPQQPFRQQLQSPLQQQQPLHHIQSQHHINNDNNSPQTDKKIQERFKLQQTYITSGGKITPPSQTKSLPESSRSSISENATTMKPMDPTQQHERGIPGHSNFIQQGHKRSLSSPGMEATSISQSPPVLNNQSPGPASVALSRGINIESGKRNNNNAMIAAAALAAAADIPLPLIKKNEEALKDQNEFQPEKSSVDASSSVKDEIIIDNRVDESVMTEPEEEDINETDDEPQSKLNTNIKSPDTSNKAEEVVQDKEGVDEEKLPPLPSQAVFSATPNEINSKLLETTAPTEAITSTRVQFKPPPLSSYQVDPDSGLIGCICGIEDDDGFTIQCDVCFRWQHCLCMDFGTNDEVPEDEYKCYYCDEAKWGKFNANHCRASTLRRLELEKLSDKNEQTEDAKPSNKRKHSSTDPKNDDKKKRKTSEKHNGTNQEKINENKPVTKLETNNYTDRTISSATDFLPNKSNELLDNGISAEQYQSVYYKLKANDYKKTTVKAFLERAGTLFYNKFSQLSKNEQDSFIPQVMTSNEFKNLKFSSIILPNQDAYLRENKELRKKPKNCNGTSIQVKLYAENQKQKFNGITRSGLFITDKDLKYEKEIIVPQETPIIEYLGEIDLFDNYVNDQVNQYSAFGTPKPKVLKVDLNIFSADDNDKSLEIVSDSRFVGNESRFIRKACPATSNCKIKPIYIPETNTFRLLVVTSKPIILSSNTNEEELRLDWEWDRLHPIRKMYATKKTNSEELTEPLKFDQFSDQDKAYLITSIDHILHFVECGCCTASSGIIQNGCAIFKVKKATSYLLRSTRKASNISNINLSKSREELIIPKKQRNFISWEERLIERDRIIQMDLHVTTNESSADSTDGNNLENNQESNEENRTSNQKHDTNISIEDSKVSEESLPLFFTLPFKQQLIAKGRRLIKEVECDEMKHDSNTNTAEEKNGIDKQSEFLSISVPVVPELVVQIRQSLDKEIEPINEIKSTDDVETVETSNNVKVEPTLSKSNNSSFVTLNSAITPTQSAGTNKVENSVASVAEGSTEEKTVEAPPPTVKKLSFADYKKKMK